MQQSKPTPFSYGWYKCVAKLLSNISNDKKHIFKRMYRTIRTSDIIWDNNIYIGNRKITSPKMRRGYVISISYNLFVSPFRFGFFGHFLF